MKKTVLVLFAILVSAAAVSAQQDGWVSLFNGKDLSGWKINGTEKYVVEDGMIYAESTTGKYGYLTTDKTYTDFVLKLKFKPVHGNSGVFTRSHILGIDPEHGPDIEGLQVEIDPERDTGGIYESGGRGWIARPTAEGEKAVKPNEWNEMEISEEGHHIVTRVNGVQIVDLDNDQSKFTSGVVGLQLHTGGGVKIYFKDIYIKELGK